MTKEPRPFVSTSINLLHDSATLSFLSSSPRPMTLPEYTETPVPVSQPKSHAPVLSTMQGYHRALTPNDILYFPNSGDGVVAEFMPILCFLFVYSRHHLMMLLLLVHFNNSSFCADRFLFVMTPFFYCFQRPKKNRTQAALGGLDKNAPFSSARPRELGLCFAGGLVSRVLPPASRSSTHDE